VAPILPVRDIEAALAFYRGLGFSARAWPGGGYGFISLDGAELHLGVDPTLGPGGERRAGAYLFVEDADALARTWRAAGAEVRPPEDTEWGQHEGVLIDPDGNMIRFGSPAPGDHPH
jgi:catechol 2,3-dioxygenase-like lactoylglutathione lyase family enzyme